MNVIHVDTGRDWRGGQSQVLMLSRGLLASGCDSLIVARNGSALARRALEENVPVQEVALRFEADVASAMKLKRIARGRKGTILHAHTPHALGIALIARGLGLSGPILFTRRVSFPIKKSTISRWKINRADSVIAVSSAVLDELIRAGIDARKTRVIHSAFDQDAFPYRGPNLQPPLSIAVLGALEKAKGLKQALQLVDSSYDLPLTFHFFGGGPDAHEFHRSRQKRNIVVHGFVQDVASFLQGMFAAVTCSPSEGFPNLVLQAMATGLPVIAMENAAIREIIASDDVGFVAGSVESVVAQLKKMLRDVSLARRVGAAAGKWVRSRFTVEKMVTQYLDLYRQTGRQSE